MMNENLRNIINEGKVVVFVDDILIGDGDRGRTQ